MLRELKASPLAKRRAACPATKAGRCRSRSPHRWFPGDDTTPASAGQSFDMSRWKVGRVTHGAKRCEDIRRATESSNRSEKDPQVCEGTCASSGRRRRNRRCFGHVVEQLLCPGNSASPWFAASCCRDGSLAVIQQIWVLESSEVPPMSEEVAVTSLGRHFNTTHPSQSSPLGSVRLHFAGKVHAYVRTSDCERKYLVPPLVLLLP